MINTAGDMCNECMLESVRMFPSTMFMLTLILELHLSIVRQICCVLNRKLWLSIPAIVVTGVGIPFAVVPTFSDMNETAK